MAKFIDVAAPDRAILCSLFSGQKHLRAVIESVLEGCLGTASVDRVPSPRTARLVLGVYTFLAGDAGTDKAKEFVSRQEGPCEFITANDSNWEMLIDEVHGERIERRMMEAFSPDAIDLANLRRLAEHTPEGVEITPITIEDARCLGRELEPNRVSLFGTPDQFIERGVGVCAREAGLIVAASTSYAVSSRRVEVAIATHPDHRRRGLAVSVGAAMLVHCLGKGLEPHWTAGNLVSSKVAVRLGLTFAGPVPVLYLRT